MRAVSRLNQVQAAAVYSKGLHGARHLSTGKSDNTDTTKNDSQETQKDSFVEEIETGVDDATKGRILPEEHKNDKVWRSVVDQLKKPDRNSLLPLHSDSESKLFSQRGRENQSSSEQNLPSSGGALSDVVDGIKLMYGLMTGKKKFSWVKKPEAEKQDQDPIKQSLELDTWEDFNEQLETTVTRLHNLNPGEEVVILGAGISGLTLAWFMAHARSDIKIRIIEKKNRVGGWMNSVNTEGKDPNKIFELGPRTLLPSHTGTKIATQLIEQLGMADVVGGIGKREKVNTKSIAFNNELIKLPSSGSETLKFLFSPIMSGVKRGVFKDFFLARPRKSTVKDESVESFISRRFNNRLANRFVSAIMRGIYAGDISELSARSTARLNRLYMLEHTKKTSVFGAMFTGVFSAIDDYSKRALPLLSQALLGENYSKYEKTLETQSMLCFDEGIGQLPQRLATELEKRFGDRVTIQLGSTIKALNPAMGRCEVVFDSGDPLTASSVISTLPAKNIAPLLTGSELAQREASEIKFTTMAVVNIYFPNKQIAPNWFGFLIPKGENDNECTGDVLGVIFDSSVRNSAVPLSKLAAALEEATKNEGPEEVVPFKLPEQNDKKQNTRESLSAERVKEFFVEQLVDDVEAKTNVKSPAARGDFPNSTNLTVMMGGHLWDGRKSLPSEREIVDSAVVALKKYLPNTQDIDHSQFTAKVTIQQDCIPQPVVGHVDRVNAIHEAVSQAYNNRLFLTGTSFGRGVGVGDCLVDSVTIASRFSNQRKLLFPQFYINNYMALTYPSMYA